MHSFMKPVILKEQSLDVLYFAGINRKRQHACVCLITENKMEELTELGSSPGS